MKKVLALIIAVVVLNGCERRHSVIDGLQPPHIDATGHWVSTYFNDNGKVVSLAMELTGNADAGPLDGGLVAKIKFETKEARGVRVIRRGLAINWGLDQGTPPRENVDMDLTVTGNSMSFTFKPVSSDDSVLGSFLFGSGVATRI